MEDASCFIPKVEMAQVVLPADTTRLILDSVENHAECRRLRAECGLDDVISYGTGLVMMFYGEPGTGKTLFAQALAKHLGKRLLTVNFPAVTAAAAAASSAHQGDDHGGEVYRFLFREARLQDAVVFFDECEALFMRRDQALGRSQVSVALGELERFDGVVLLATNRPFDLDAAMHRRISLAVEFPAPDAALRREIWRKHMVPGLRVNAGVDFEAIAADFELPGGFIKNAVLMALSLAVARARREGLEQAEIGEADLREACRQQARGRLQAGEALRDRRAPAAGHGGFGALVLPDDLLQQLRQAAEFEKARSLLGRQGFDNVPPTVVLLQGSAGVGKKVAAAALTKEIGGGRCLQVLPCAELLRLQRAVGPSTAGGRKTTGLLAFFADAALAQAVVVLDHAEEICRAEARESDAAEVFWHVGRYAGCVVLCLRDDTTRWAPHEPLPSQLVPLVRWRLRLSRPDRLLRLRLWRQLRPAAMPLTPAAHAALEEVAAGFEFTGAQIRGALLRASAAAALRGSREEKEKKERGDDGVGATATAEEPAGLGMITVGDLRSACEAEQALRDKEEALAGMYG